MNIQQKYIKRCLELAKNGLGNTYPNPMVGCVIVCKGKIIGEGWHKKAGEPHAEVNAIYAVADKMLLKSSELYVNLEPCSHYGKTPPCADLIVKYKIPKVIIGALDTNKKVNGKGMAHLKNSGCKVTVGVLEKECLALNKRFYTYHNLKRPFIILKWAASADGFIAKKQNKDQKREPYFITNACSLQLVHQWRDEEQAILVGTTTAVADNPRLDVRHISGRNPIRIVLDRTLRVPKESFLFDKTVKTIVITDVSQIIATESSENLAFEGIDFSKEMPQQICDVLYRYKIQSVIVEGGRQTLQSFIDAELWDEARVFKGSVSLKLGVKAPHLKGDLISTQNILEDQLSIFRR
ncbi:MAG: bifunctional diaminohydroxyphosphoribosylaminopyrimidine deaminase/5-amino-6-(5-phosphoribosylamino)uracil reductase RibD [Flavobacteriaceae bacterium]|nr:bifunctional diaminohydroxyphosphoribosylaminopyrimidine deaminase/5-amino-6-(5-phosphoribosylamino)uracil reductase RibD [Flavobacteriaceae bacterium]